MNENSSLWKQHWSSGLVSKVGQELSTHLLLAPRKRGGVCMCVCTCILVR